MYAARNSREKYLDCSEADYAKKRRRRKRVDAGTSKTSRENWRSVGVSETVEMSKFKARASACPRRGRDVCSLRDSTAIVVVASGTWTH